MLSQCLELNVLSVVMSRHSLSFGRFISVLLF